MQGKKKDSHFCIPDMEEHFVHQINTVFLTALGFLGKKLWFYPPCTCMLAAPTYRRVSHHNYSSNYSRKFRVSSQPRIV